MISLDPAVVSTSLGKEMHALITRLFPICRSITGDGVRETLNIIKREIPLVIHEVPSGTNVFDWEIPKEWNIKDAYIKDSKGKKIVDFKNSNLHVLNYSIPVHKHVTLDELKKHLYYLPEHPEWIPYRTSYYKEDWGFCISYNQFKELGDDVYEVCIESSLEQGSLTYGECLIPGELTDEILLSAHVCHPSLANDNLSGISVATFLVKHLLNAKPRYSYRFVFIPGTIGAITWLSINEQSVNKIKHGLVASLLGDKGHFTYKRSRIGNAEIDQVVEMVLMARNSNNKVIDFFPYGYDERQYCSPGFNLPVGCLSRTPFGQYIQYHTSADDLDFIDPGSLEDSFHTYVEIFDVLEANRKFVNQNPTCEPQLGKRGLYSLKGGNNDTKDFQMALLWVLNLSDGEHSLLDISKRANMKFETIQYASSKLVECHLLKERQSN
jgi:aminopeptidase-like protein